MRSPTIPSVDQLLVLLAVVEAGGFAAAGRRLKRATSAISYAIDTLETQLGVALFDRAATQRPRLTPAGEAIVAEARAVAHSVDTLLARVKGLAGGLEPEVSLVVDCMCPADFWVPALRDFHKEFPTVPVRLLIQPLGAVERTVRNGQANIGVGGLLHMDGIGMQCIQVGGVRTIPVAAPQHPLAVANNTGLGSDHVQIVLSEQPEGEARDYGVVSLMNWRVGDLMAKRKLLLAGLGWGGMPVPMVRGDLESRRLVQLDLLDWRGGEYLLQVVHKIDTPPGPAGKWLIERIVAAFRSIETQENLPAAVEPN